MKIIKTIPIDQLELETLQGWTLDQVLDRTVLEAAADTEPNTNPGLVTYGSSVYANRHHVVKQLVALVSKDRDAISRETDLEQANDALRVELAVHKARSVNLDDHVAELKRYLESAKAAAELARNNLDRETNLLRMLEHDMAKVRHYIGEGAWKKAVDG